MCLRRRGIDILTAQQDGTQRFDDEALQVRATELERLLFTQDDDFLEIASRWQQQNRNFAGIVYCHQLASGIGEIVEDLELVVACTSDEEVRDRVTYLPLR